MRKLLTIISLLFALTTKAQMLNFHQLTVKDGLLHNGIIALGQDAKGHIWVATFGGLLRYDGQELTPLPYDDLPDKRIDRINCAQDGTMWVRCYENRKQISRYDSLTNHFVTYNISDLSDSVRQQAVQPLNRTFVDPRSSRVWSIEKMQFIQTDTLNPQATFIYKGETAIDAGLKDEIFYSILLDRQGVLWIGSANNGLFFADTRQSHYRRLVCQPSPMVRATLKDSKGTLWIAISDQQLLTLPKGACEVSPVSYPMTDSIKGRRIRAITEDSKGRLWVGGQDGLYVKDASSNSFQRIDIINKVLVSVFCFSKDKKGMLWIGTNNGLFKLNIEERHPLVELADTTVSFIEKIAADKDGLWISNQSGLYRKEGNKVTQWYEESAHTIVTDVRGQTWVGTDNGLIRVTPKGVEHVNTAADGHIVKDLLCWRDFLWCSYEQGLCCVNIYTDQSTLLHTEHNEYLDGSACIDSHTGTLYFGGTLGLDCFSADSLEEKLRSGTPQLWLEENSEELRVKREESPSAPVWPYVLFLLIGCGAIGFTYLYIIGKRQNETIAATDQRQEPTPLSPFILKATAVAEAHIADADFTAEQMAQELAMSRTKLFLLMKKETGKAVMEFVRDIRLDYAARQLEAGTPVGEIYMACGFSDPSSFRRSFVKKFGINPSQYREKRRQ